MKKQLIAFVRDDLRGLRFVDKDSFLAFLSDFGAGTKLKISIENYFPQRSLSQNGALHWWIDLIAENCSLSPARMKEILAYKFLKRPALDKEDNEMFDEDTGEIDYYVPSTSDLDVAEMVVFMDKIHLWAIEHRGLDLPLPDKNYKIHFLNEHKETLKTK